MNKTWRNIGLMALAAGVLYYPALRMYRKAHDNQGDNVHEDDMKLEKGIFKVSKKKTPKQGGGGNQASA